MRETVFGRAARFRELSQWGRAGGGILLLGTMFIGISLLTPKRTESSVAAAVQVVNTPLPVDVEGSSTRIPYGAIGDFGTLFGTNSGSVSVPAGKQFNIEFVSGYCDVVAPQLWSIELSTTLNTSLGSGSTEQHLFPQYSTFTNNRYDFVISQPVRTYASSGRTILISSATPILNLVGECRISLTGYLVNSPN